MFKRFYIEINFNNGNLPIWRILSFFKTNDLRLLLNFLLETITIKSIN